MISGELIFNIGIAASAIGLSALLIGLFIYMGRLRSLKAVLDAEYGKKDAAAEKEVK